MQTVGPEFLSSHQLRTAVSMGSPITTLALPPPRPCNPSSLSSTGLLERTQCLAVDLCIGFHQLLDEGSLMIGRVVTILIIGDGQFRHPLYYC